jgi:hypothetical protein
MSNLYIGINLNQPYCCLITLQEENFLEVVAVPRIIGLICGMPANPYRDRQARLPDLSQPANAAIRQQFQGNNPADAQFIRGNNPPVFNVSGPIRDGSSGQYGNATSAARSNAR